MKDSIPGDGCVECGEVITNPICSECLANEMQIMIAEHDEKLAEEIVGFRLDGGSSCITCGRSMGICAHCFSKDIYLYLKERGSPIADEFIGRFDFDLRKQFV